MADKPISKLSEMHRQMLLGALSDKEKSVRRFSAARPQYNSIFVEELKLIDELKSLALSW